GQKLRVLELGVGVCGWGGDGGPRLRLDRNLPALPGAAPELDRRLEEGELVRPRGEPALAAEAIEPGEDRDQCVVRGLVGDVVELVAAEVRHRAPPPGDLESGR